MPTRVKLVAAWAAAIVLFIPAMVLLAFVLDLFIHAAPGWLIFAVGIALLGALVKWGVR